MNIRKIEANDIETIKYLYSKWFPVIYSDNYYNDVILNDDLIKLVVVMHDTIIGVVIAKYRYDIDDIKNVYIMTIGTKKEYRQNGIASLLLQKCCELAIDNNCRYICLHVKADNENAIKFYEKNDFIQFELLTDFYFIDNNNFDAYTYYKVLN